MEQASIGSAISGKLLEPVNGTNTTEWTLAIRGYEGRVDTVRRSGDATV